jgi:thiol-disulfide isomerase/thioredoxin
MRKLIYIFSMILFAAALGFAGGKAEKPKTPATPPQQSGSAAASQQTDQSPALTAVQQALVDIGISPFREGVHSIDFTVQNLEGRKKSLTDYRGKIVFLNFWATWCPPCRAEMPSMQTLYTKMKGKDFDIVAVNVQENADAVHTFMKSENTTFTFPILLDATGRVASTYSVRGIPTTYVIAKDGTMLGMVVGGKDWADPKVIDTLTQLANGKLIASAQ